MVEERAGRRSASLLSRPRPLMAIAYRGLMQLCTNPFKTSSRFMQGVKTSSWEHVMCSSIESRFPLFFNIPTQPSSSSLLPLSAT
jgi:hypothetical protein